MGEDLVKTLKAILDKQLPDTSAPSAGDASARAVFKDRLRAIIDEADAAAGRRLVEAARAGVQPVDNDDNRLYLLRRELADTKVAPTVPEVMRWWAALVAMQIVERTLDPADWNRLPAAPIEALARAKRVAAGLQAVAALETDKWRGRHIAYLDRRIENKALQDMTNAAFGDPGKDAEIREWRRQIAETAYKRREYERLDKIESSVLDDIPPQSEDYGRARAEAERLKAEIAQTAEALVAGARSAPAAARLLPLTVKRVPASCIHESIEGGRGWYFGDGATAPEFVIVLDRPGAGPTSAEACLWREFQ